MTRSGITPFLEKKKHDRDFHSRLRHVWGLETIAGTLVEGVNCFKGEGAAKRPSPLRVHLMPCDSAVLTVKP
jgi:hypothetical protein